MEAAEPHWMDRAIALATTQVGRTGTNPPVGCVLVRDGVVVGQGATADGGRPHAEEMALVMAGDLARGAHAYLTLEPCAQRSGGAPSCAERLANAGVAQVSAACADPSVFAGGRGAETLRAAGVAFDLGLQSLAAQVLYADYRPVR